MTTSGSFTPNTTFDILNIIEESYERAGKEVRSGYDMRSARRSLDLLTKEWSNRGVNLWTIEVVNDSVSAGTSSVVMDADHIDVLECLWRTGTGVSQNDRQMTRVSVREWASIANKNTTGDPSEWWVHRTDPPTINFWPVPEEAGTLHYYVMRHLEDAGAYSNNVDIPPRFLPALIAGLSYYLALKSPDAMDRLQLLKADYENQFQMATNEDRERASLRLVPRLR